ncbi:hypothetical protein GURASL_18070 [Geotalea uraniireducens]|uniref:Uncharacterized protein n=1 Tax=Geotalea uraniireducens TaxID=351604 RepID=A0ABN6VS42_9BACT|nr:hypothetical protein [Geotalea uraniireducens]BDV42884.1 hypothetical protein GURASL_18070 [Geotalea uraniireducens]
MKKLVLVLAAATFALAAPLMAGAAEHGSMDMDHGDMKMDYGAMKMEKGGMMTMGKVIHQGKVDGVKFTVRAIDIKAKMEKMGMKETNHIMVMFSDAKTGKAMADGEVTMKIVGPDKSEQVKKLMGMEEGFGSDFVLAQKGKYGIMAKFKLGGNKVQQFKFWYTVK